MTDQEVIRQFMFSRFSPLPDTERDVHTEHCCVVHGCRYRDENCPVATGKKRQSYPCDDCESDWAELDLDRLREVEARLTERQWGDYQTIIQSTHQAISGFAKFLIHLSPDQKIKALASVLREAAND